MAERVGAVVDAVSRLCDGPACKLDAGPPLVDGLLSALIQRAAETPDAQFVTISASGEETPCTASSLIAGGQRYAGACAANGARAGEPILISLKPGAELLHAFIGALMIGCIPSMMAYPSAKQDGALFWKSHRDLFEHIGGGIFTTFEDNVAAVTSQVRQDLLRVVTPEDAQSATPLGSFYEWKAEEVCCLQHSSGTTGLKEGVTLTFAAIAAQIESYRQVLGLDVNDTIVSWLPLYHDMGFVATFLMPLVTGNQSVIMSPFDWTVAPLKLFDAIERHDGRFIWLPNFAFNHLVNAAFDDEPIRSLGGIKAFINCSEPCKTATFDRFVDRFASWGVRHEQLQVCYAMAETIFAVSQSEVGKIVKRLAISKSALQDRSEIAFGPHVDDTIDVLSVGAPIPGIELKKIGVGAGEILVRGPFVFGSYYKDAAQTELAFDEGWYRTGDIGFLHDNELYVLGRQKDLLIVYGKNFFAHEIEALVSAVPGVKPGRVAAFGIFNDRLGSEEAILVAELADDAADNASIRKAIKSALEGIIGLVPKKILLEEQGWLVKSTSGKVSRKENQAKYLAALDG